jgi:ribosomal protein S27E
MSSSDKTHHKAVEVICPRCRHTEIVYFPVDDLPMCPYCKIRMSISELLDEGKSY